MRSVQVNLGDRSYPIHVKSGLMKQVASILSDQNRGQEWINNPTANRMPVRTRI